MWCILMTMRRTVLSLLLFSSAMVFGHPLDRAWVKGVTDRDPLSYGIGERMTFTLTVEDVADTLPEGEYFLRWTRSGDDGLREEGQVPLDGKPFVYATQIAKAGFVRLQAHVADRNGKKYRKPFTGDTSTPAGKAAKRIFERTNSVFFDGGAGAAVETLQTEPEPKDFDAFWAKQFARLDRVPIKADRVEMNSPNPRVRLYAVRVDCAGLRPVTGYLGVPKAVDEGKTFPARLKTEGYSGCSCTQDAVTRVPDDELFLRINAHGLKLVEFGATEADTKALRWEIGSHDAKASYQGYAFDEQQNADPETAYFNGMVLRVKRALQYLKTLEGWNGRDLIASGGSQGGLQTVWAAACGEGVTRAEPYVTWCCDMYTSGKLRRDRSLGLAADDWYVPWVEALGYYDAAIFAKRIPKTCHVNVTRVGLGDYCCPPTGLAKFWNNIPGNKEIHWMQGSQHDYEPPAYEGRDFVRKVD